MVGSMGIKPYGNNKDVCDDKKYEGG